MNVKNLALGIGIIVVFALALWQGIEAFHPSPKYENYCNESLIPVPVIEGKDMSNNLTYCVEHNGTWREGYCDLYYKCRMAFEEAQKPYSKVVFVVSLIVAIIAIIAGYAILSIEPVGSALIGSGVWALFYGTVVNWRNFTNIWRFLLLFVTLIFLIWLALRLNRRRKK